MVEKRFAFDLELFVVAKRQGFNKFVEMPVQINERFTSTVSIRSVKQTLLDTLAIFYRLRLMHYYDRDISLSEVDRAHADPSYEETSINQLGTQ